MVTYTSSSTYWAPLKPRIRIYAFSDSSYSSPLYSYNPFTDVGTTTKPVSLNFESQTTNAGAFSIEIEDADSSLDVDALTRGNRVFIDCSKDGSTFQPAFKGLVRSSEQVVYAPTGRNFVLSGYSYLIRLNERIVNVIKESALSGTDYDRTDSTMFTNNLIEDLLTTDSNYVSAADDRALYNLPNPANISNSTITDWIPRLDAELVTVGSAIDSVLEYSNSLINVDISNDEWIVYNPEQSTLLPQSFLITDNMVQTADDGDITMYPLEPYKYNVSYDYPDSASRLILALNTSTGDQCPAEPEVIPPAMASDYDSSIQKYLWTVGGPNDIGYAFSFVSATTNMRGLRVALANLGNVSGENVTHAEIRPYVNIGTAPGTIIGSVMDLHRIASNGEPTPGLAYPSVNTLLWYVGLAPGDVGPTISAGTYYWLYIYPDGLVGDLSTQDNSNKYALIDEGTGSPFVTTNNGSTWSAATGTTGGQPRFRFDYASPGRDACGGGGGLATDLIAAPQFVVAHDLNATNRLGMVERAITSIPRHITTLQTINEYLYSKLYLSSKPRFTFDYPSVTVPGKIPKAGDVVTHVSERTGVGLMARPLQTGVIMSISYNFEQSGDQSLGLRRMSLMTTGIRRGSY